MHLPAKAGCGPMADTMEYFQQYLPAHGHNQQEPKPIAKLNYIKILIIYCIYKYIFYRPVHNVWK